MLQENNPQPLPTPARSHISEENNKFLTVSPYREGKKDKNFVNPSLISHDVFYNLDYPKPDKSIPYCRKRQTVTEKITNLQRSFTPEPRKSNNMNEYNQNEQKSALTTPINPRKQPDYAQNEQKSAMTTPINPREQPQKPGYKSHKNLHLEDFKENEQQNVVCCDHTVKKEQNPIINKETPKELPVEPYNNMENFEKNSEKSVSMTSFTRNKDNLICDYCINQELIDKKREEKELEDRRNKQIQQLNEHFYHSLFQENLFRETEKKRLCKESREAQLQNIENKRNQYKSQKNFSINYEKEVTRLQEEENRLMREKKLQEEKAKKDALKKDLENQIYQKNSERQQYLTDRNSNRDIALNINNQYYNPYLPSKRDYFQEIEKQKAVKEERNYQEKEEQRKNYLLGLEQQKRLEAEEKKIVKEDNRRKQLYAQKILQDIEERKMREQQQKNTEREYYRTMYEKQNDEQKNLTLQQFYDKKLKEARLAKNLQDQISDKRNNHFNLRSSEKIQRELAEIEDLLAAQKVKNYNCKKCHKQYPKSLLNKCAAHSKKE